VSTLTAPSPIQVAIGGLLALAVGIGIGRFVYTPILPSMQEDLGLKQTAAGLIAAANFAGYLAGALAAMRAQLAGSRRAWLLGALGASAISTGGMGATTALPAFLLLRFVGGVASALALILSSALVLETLADARRQDLAALHFAGVGVGIAVSAGLVGALQAIGTDWRSLWLASGGISLLATGVVAVLVPDHRTASSAPAKRRAGPSDPRLIRLIGAYGLFGFGYVITATFLVAIVRATPSIRTLEVVIWIVVGLAAGPSVAFWTQVGRLLGVPGAFALAALAEALGVLASVVWPSEAGILVAGVLLGGTFMGLTALGLIRGQELATGDPRRAIAGLTGAFGVGQMIGPLLAGVVSDALGGFTVPSLAAAGALLLAAMLARM
jgi:predicted MFS family arabinose efflux permease